MHHRTWHPKSLYFGASYDGALEISGGTLDSTPELHCTVVDWRKAPMAIWCGRTSGAPVVSSEVWHLTGLIALLNGLFWDGTGPIRFTTKRVRWTHTLLSGVQTTNFKFGTYICPPSIKLNSIQELRSIGHKWMDHLLAIQDSQVLQTKLCA